MMATKMRNVLAKIVLLVLLLAEISIGQETGAPFQIVLRVHQKNLNRIDQFDGEIDFNKPLTFKVTIYEKDLCRDLNIFKINIYEEPIGFLKNKQDYPPIIPFRKYFLFQIEPIKYDKQSKKLTVTIDYVIDEMIQTQSNDIKQNIIRSFKSVEENITLGEPFYLTEINSVDPAQQASLEIFNQDVKPPYRVRNEKFARFIPEKYRQIDNYNLPPISWMVLHLISDQKIEQKFWLDQMVTFPLLDHNQNKNFSFVSLTSRLEYLYPEQKQAGNQHFLIIFIPRKVIGKKIDFTLFLFESDPEITEHSRLMYQKDLKIIADEPLEVEVEFSKSNRYRFFFYITAYFEKDMKEMNGKQKDR
jgi:hypothetical protein